MYAQLRIVCQCMTEYDTEHEFCKHLKGFIQYNYEHLRSQCIITDGYSIGLR